MTTITTDWVAGYTNAWNTHDGRAVVAHMTEDVTFVDLALGERFSGTEQVRAFVDGMSTAFSSDYAFTLGLVVGDGDACCFEWRLAGTNDCADPVRGLPPTGRRFDVPGVSVVRLRDGRIAQERDYWNLADYLGQVGLMPG